MKRLEDKAFRHELYKAAKIYYCTSQCTCMCAGIIHAMLNKYDSINEINGYLPLLPEFISLMPKDKKLHEYWWPEIYRTLRINKFDLIIEQTKP